MATITYVTGTDWDDPDTWDLARAPEPGDAVLIPVDAGAALEIASTVDVTSISLASGNSLFVLGVGDVTATLTAAAGSTLLFGDGATFHGSVAVSGTFGAGDLVAQADILGDADWTFNAPTNTGVTSGGWTLHCHDLHSTNSNFDLLGSCDITATGAITLLNNTGGDITCATFILGCASFSSTGYSLGLNLTSAGAMTARPGTNAAATVTNTTVTGAEMDAVGCIDGTGNTNVRFVDTYALTMVDGTDNTDASPYAAAASVSISADAADPGFAFDYWSSDAGGSFLDDTDPNTTFTMPASAVTVTAMYVPVFELTVNNGSGDGEYETTTVVPIEADAPVPGEVFDAWTGDTSGVADVNSASTTYTMDAMAAEITATYVPEEEDAEPNTGFFTYF